MHVAIIQTEKVLEQIFNKASLNSEQSTWKKPTLLPDSKLLNIFSYHITSPTTTIPLQLQIFNTIS